MDWQQLVSLMIVGAAVLSLAAGVIFRRRFTFQRGTHCGFAAASESASQSSIVFHARKGERPVVIVKMK
jgi:hypothetical protein